MTTGQLEPAVAKPAPKKWLRIVGYIFLAGIVLIGGFCVYVATLPSDFKYQRSATIKAPADTVFPLINDFHNWPKWSPWENIDPKLKRTYEGAEAGKGAIYSWVGNAEVGEGQMTILESKPAELVSIKLEFFKPFAGVCPTTFKLDPTDEGTKVSWTMEGQNHFIAKAMCLFMDMDKMIGKNFDDGLAKMSTVAQAEAKKSAEGPAKEEADKVE